MKRQSLTLIVLFILLIGLLFITISSVTEAVTFNAGDKLYFIRKQLLWSGIGIFAYFFASRIKISLFKSNASFFFYSTIILLAILLLPKFSSVTLGARRWLDLGFIAIQPSEILKLTAVIFFSKLFSTTEGLDLKKLVILLSIPLILVLFEPNLSTAILVAAIVLTLYYLAGGEIISLFLICAAAVVISLGLIFSSPYRKARLDNTSYHSSQMILALSSGHLTGKGFANSDQKYRFLPKISTDSIMAVIGEETGFVGSSIIISLYLYLVLTMVKISTLVTDNFSKLFISGITCWVAFQSLINISAVASLIPLTGVPLPLISYGGSSLITLMFALGLVNNLYLRTDKLIYSTKRENSKNHHHHRHPSHPSHRSG